MFKTLAVASALAATAAAQSAIITVEAFKCGAGSCTTNTTIDVPIGSVYSNASALDEVSFLYLTSSTGVAPGSITCTPYKDTSGSGDAGLPFNSTTPSLLSTNLVKIGSIVCHSLEPIGVPGSSSMPSESATSSASSVTSVTRYMPIPTNSATGNYSTSNIKTLPPIGGSTISTTMSSTEPASSMPSGSTTVMTIAPTMSGQEPSTVTSVVIASGTEPATTAGNPGSSSSASASPSLNTNNAAGSVRSDVAFGGLAAALMGVAFAL